MQRSHTAVLVVGAVIAAAVTVVAWSAIATLVSLPEDARAGRTMVSVRTPIVAPGDAIEIDIKVYGGKRAGIHEVTVTGGERELRVAGRGQTWGRAFRATDRDTGQAHARLSIEVPPDARPGAPLPIVITVRHVVAEERGLDRFVDVEGTDRLELSLPVRSPSQRDFGRLRTVVVAGLALVLAIVLAFVGTPPANRWLRARRPGPRTLSWGAATVLVVFAVLATLATFCAAGALALAGWFWFARELIAARVIDGGVLAWVATGAWIGLPVLAGAIALQRTAGELTIGLASTSTSAAPYRDALGDGEAPVRHDLVDIADSLRAGGLTVARRGRRLRVSRGGGASLVLRAVVDPARVDDLRGVTRDAVLAIEAAHALVPRFGAIEVSISPVAVVVVDAARGRDAAIADYHGQLQDAVRKALAAITRPIVPPR